MSKNTKGNADEMPKNTGTEQNTIVGLDITETKGVKKQGSDGNKKGGNEVINTGNKASNKPTGLTRTTSLDENNINADKDSYKETREFVIFQNELKSLIDNNLYILKECKSTKRLLDIKYSELETYINYIQISVIALSTMSGFLQSTKNYFGTAESIVSVSGIGISTYISLILSVSKYFKLDEQKERIHNLREKYATLHNKIEYRMDVLGPRTRVELWEHQDVKEKLQEWKQIKEGMDEEYIILIETKQGLTTEYESIMDSKARNKNYITDRKLVLNNRNQLFSALQQHNALEQKIKNAGITTDFKSAIELPDDDLNNWDDPV
tara:strand:- start:1298 stop:2266 length:969 start_codon:yes stop_codon:yes gene_type:complete